MYYRLVFKRSNLIGAIASDGSSDFVSPIGAANAYYLADLKERPYVLHFGSGGSATVITSITDGKKSVTHSSLDSGAFKHAFESISNTSGVIR